jgi:hypothetical protein
MNSVQTENKLGAVDALVVACRRYPGLDPRDVLEAIDDPQWSSSGPINDWRNNIISDVIEIWGLLGHEARLAFYLQAAADSFCE